MPGGGYIRHVHGEAGPGVKAQGKISSSVGTYLLYSGEV